MIAPAKKNLPGKEDNLAGQVYCGMRICAE